MTRREIRRLRIGSWALAAIVVPAAIVVLSAGSVAALEVPYLSGRVNDLADLISSDTEGRIVTSLEDFETRTGHQVVVLTIASLEGEALEEFSLRVAETWGTGRAAQDDGVLLLIAKDDRKMRIEVGYGLEADLTDAESGRILRNILTPRFKAGDFDGGIEQGVAAIIDTLEGKEVIAPESSDPSNSMPIGARLVFGGMFLLVVGLFSLTAIFTTGRQSWFLYAFLIPFWGSFPLVIFGPSGGLIALLGWVIGAPILKLLFGNTAFGKRWGKSHPGWTTWTSGSGGGWSGGGGGGFSGGGGSFGGGGASGSW